jgi:AraC family transcriptional regulator, glycine betaine-responsive activator
MATTSLTNAAFLLFDGFSNMVLASAMEPLRAANNLVPSHRLHWQVVTLDGAPVQSSSGLMIAPDLALADLGACDVLFVIAGYGVRRHAGPDCLQALRRTAKSVPLIGGLDVGGWLLAAAGLLRGRSATVHWQTVAEFEEEFLTVTVLRDRFVVDGNRITAGGATSVMELMLHLIRREYGEALAFDVSNLFLYDAESGQRAGVQAGVRAGVRAGWRVGTAATGLRAPQLQVAVEQMRDTVEDPVPVAGIARASALSLRTLERLFQRELGVSPARYYLMTRLSAARNLAEETGLSVAEIAARTGFSSVSTLSRAFRAHFGQSIRDLRAARLASPRG